jgi:aminopeptidase N
MTDRQGALGVLVSLDAPEREAALDAFYDRFRDDPLVLDKWFALQAAAQRADTVDQVRGWRPSDFTSPIPTAARAGRQLRRQPMGVPPADGRGYRFLADMIIAATSSIPQVAARLVPPLGRWRRFEPSARR